MSLMNDGLPVPLHEIPRGSYVQVAEGTWRQLAGWRVLDKVRPDSPRFQVLWARSELYPSTFVKEPSWPVWTGDRAPDASVSGGSDR